MLAADVKYSFDGLTGKLSHPAYRAMFADVKDAMVLGERTVQFHFRRPSAELPLIVGGMPVFSRDWGAGKPFDQIIMDIPIGSGPYRVGHVDFGRDITYQRDPEVLGGEPQRAQGHVQLRPGHLQDLQGHHRPDRGLQGRRVRLHPGVLGPGVGAHLRGQEVHRRGAGQAQPAQLQRRGLPGLRASTPGARSSPTCGCARRWSWAWTSSG